VWWYLVCSVIVCDKMVLTCNKLYYTFIMYNYYEYKIITL